MACINCQSRKVKCSYLQSNDCCDRCLAKQLRCEPHKSQQERRTDLDMEEESLTRSGHNASQSKREDSLDFDDTYCVVDVFSQGTRGLWYISNSDSTTLSYHPISSRVAMLKEGISTYIMCSCVSNLLQGWKSSFGVFKRKTSSSWHLAVVQSFFYLILQDGSDKIHLLEWTGSISSDGNPDFYNATTWENFSDLLPQESFILVTWISSS